MAGIFQGKELIGKKMVTHKLKIDPKYFEDVRLATKTFEIRKNDRNFHVGDKLLLCEYDRDKKEYTGNQLTATITYITDFAQKDGYIVIALNNIIYLSEE